MVTPQSWSPHPDLLLRRARPADGELVAAMAARLSEDEGSTEPTYFTAEDFRRHGFGTAPLFRCLIAELSGAPAGYVLYCREYDTDHLCRSLYMADLYVEKAARRRGIGHDLMAAMADDGRLWDAPLATWTALRHNVAARDFYRDIGHEQSGLVECIAETVQFRALVAEAESPPSAICLRPAVASDCPVLAAFLAGLYREVHRPPPADIEGKLRRDGFGAEPAYAALIAETMDGAPIGYALYWLTYITQSAMTGALLSDLYVVPDWRRRGVARALIAATARAASDTGGGYVIWAVDAENEHGRAFYRTIATEAAETVVYGCDLREFARLADRAAGWRR
jgi:GNAT superfamily N-acetyltransferase